MRKHKFIQIFFFFFFSFISFYENSTISIPKSGYINTIAGNVEISSDGTPALEISVFPNALALDLVGNLYFSNLNVVQMESILNQNIWSIAGNGQQTGFPQNGTSTSNSTFSVVEGLAFGSSTSLFVADGTNSLIRKIEKGIVTIIAGIPGESGYNGNDIPALNATLNYSTFITFSSNGDLFVSDYLNGLIRKIDMKSGIISNIAGIPGVLGYNGNDIIALNATLNGSVAITFNLNGDLFFSDSFNHLIRKIDMKSGIISNIAGIPGVLGYNRDNIPALNATLNYPTGINFDLNGNLFIADSANSLIRKIDMKSGIISNIAGIPGVLGYGGNNIPALNSILGNPKAITFDLNGDLFFTDSGIYLIRKIDMKSGIISTLIGGYNGDNSLCLNARLHSPSGIVFDLNGNLFISDSYNRIRKIDTKTGIINTIAGNGINIYSGNNLLALNTSINVPTSTVFDLNGDLFFSDTRNGLIRKIDMKNRIVSNIAGIPGKFGYNGNNIPALNATLNNSIGITFDLNGDLFISDSGNGLIRKIDMKSGIISNIAGTPRKFGYNRDNIPALNATLNYPTGITFDLNGDLFFADSFNHLIRKIDMKNGIIFNILGPTFLIGNQNYTFNLPVGIVFDSKNNLFISDSILNSIFMLLNSNPNHQVLLIAGNLNQQGNFSGDNEPAYLSTLNSPTFMTFDSNDNLFICDGANNRIRAIGNLYPNLILNSNPEPPEAPKMNRILFYFLVAGLPFLFVISLAFLTFIFIPKITKWYKWKKTKQIIAPNYLDNYENNEDFDESSKSMKNITEAGEEEKKLLTD